MVRFAAALARVLLLGPLLLVPLLFDAGPARAQSPVVIVANFGPGAANDVAARLLAAEFAPDLGVPFVVKNTTGAAGTIGAIEAVRARPDGQTLLLSPIGPVTIQPSFMRNAGYRTADLVPICQVSDAALVIQTPRASGLRTLADLEARARAAGGGMPYGSTGPGTLTHLSMVAWTRAAGAPISHVPYRTPGDVIFAMQQGGVPVLSDQPAMVRPNDLHVLAVFAPERLAEFPDAPTVRELGHDLSFSIWQGLFAPAGTPPAVLARYEAACARAVRSQGFRTGMDRIQTPVVHRNAKDFAAVVARDSERMRTMIEEGGLRQAE
jgi:tripartite-type tricarboxylate transporter receptor subunit TctC